MSVEKNWQTTRPTIKERSKFMFNNDLFSDIKFVVPKAIGESESKQVIYAHKFVLSISSPVFEAMFYGELAETRGSIELPDSEYESLLELFRYMYSDEVNLNGSNVMGVLYLAKKYMVPSLAEKCTEYLHDNLDPTNAFSILPSAQKYEEKNLVERCWRIIDIQTQEAMKSNGFESIERSLLLAVVVRDTLAIEEIELFKAVDLWATKECERQGLAANGTIKRIIVGEEVIKAIRFPAMKQEDFTTVVLDSKTLTPNEIVSIIKSLSSVPRSPVGFSETKRPGLGIRRCCRFSSLSRIVSKYHFSFDAITFAVNKDIVLQGVCLFGSENNTYSIELKVTGTNIKSVLAGKTGQFSSRPLQCEKYSYYGLKVLFDMEIILKKNKVYEVWAKIKGPDSLRGENGAGSVNCQGVEFTFFWDRDSCFNGTNVLQGEFPEFLFDIK